MKDVDAVIAILGQDPAYGQTLKAMKELLGANGIENYFIVTTDATGRIGQEELDFGEDKIWEMNGSAKYYQCDHGMVFPTEAQQP